MTFQHVFFFQDVLLQSSFCVLLKVPVKKTSFYVFLKNNYIFKTTKSSSKEMDLERNFSKQSFKNEMSSKNEIFWKKVLSSKKKSRKKIVFFWRRCLFESCLFESGSLLQGVSLDLCFWTYFCKRGSFQKEILLKEKCLKTFFFWVGFVFFSKKKPLFLRSVFKRTLCWKEVLFKNWSMLDRKCF